MYATQFMQLECYKESYYTTLWTHKQGHVAAILVRSIVHSLCLYYPKMDMIGEYGQKSLGSQCQQATSLYL